MERVDLATAIVEHMEQAAKLCNTTFGPVVPMKYSGRGMFGKECLALRSPGRSISVFTIAACISTAFSQAYTGFQLTWLLSDLSRTEVREDNLGTDTLIYFPDLAWP